MSGRIRGIAALLLAVILLLMITGTLIIDTRLRPMLSSYGNNQATTAASRAISAAATRVLTQMPVQYDELVTIRRDESDKITSVEVNAESMNRLKSAVSDIVMEELDNQRFQYVSIPAGSLFGGLLTGRGPDIKVKVPMNSSVTADYSNSFSGAGINQTRHAISVEVKVNVFAVIQGEEMSVETQSEFLLAESVLVGEVPSWMPGLQSSG